MNPFQQKLYTHLIQYKLNTLNLPSSEDKSLNDVQLSKENRYFNLLEPNRADTIDYIKSNGIKEHIHFNHLASSQAACLNLFMPLRKNHELANLVLKQIIPGFHKLIDIQFEYYHENDYLGEGRKNKGIANVGTDADVAIFYTDGDGNQNIYATPHSSDHRNHFFN